MSLSNIPITSSIICFISFRSKIPILLQIADNLYKTGSNSSLIFAKVNWLKTTWPNTLMIVWEATKSSLALFKLIIYLKIHEYNY